MKNCIICNLNYCLFYSSRIQLGVNNVVILNSFEAVKDGLSKDTVSGRPEFGITKIFFKSSSIVDDSGQEWREQRRLLTQFLRGHTIGNGDLEAVVRSMRSIILLKN